MNSLFVNRLTPVALTLAISLLSVVGQTPSRSVTNPEYALKMRQASELSRSSREMRKLGMLDIAETQILASIQLLRESGWAASGERALLGMIMIEKGLITEGFNALNSSYPGALGNEEMELYRAMVALDLGDIDVLRQSFKYFLEGRHSVNYASHELRDYWPKGNTLPSLKAAIYFLEGSRLVEERLEGVQKGIGLLKRAHQIEPRNIAIQFNLARAYRQVKDYGAAAPFYKFVADNAEGHLQRQSATQYAKFKNVKPKATSNPPATSGSGGS